MKESTLNLETRSLQYYIVANLSYHHLNEYTRNSVQYQSNRFLTITVRLLKTLTSAYKRSNVLHRHYTRLIRIKNYFPRNV